MKKLLTTAAVCGLVVAANPAMANIDLELGGHFKGYGVYVDQDAVTATPDAREFDFVRETEIHAGGEATLDNGLTIGFHTEVEADVNATNDSLFVEESYLYMSSAWGRINLGAEDGAAYLLQVAAPSADSNYDGIRQYVSPVNYTAPGITTTLADLNDYNLIDYDQNPTEYADKITYLSPVMGGLQLGLTYAPDVSDETSNILLDTQDVDGDFGSAYEASLRYEGQYDMIGFTFGGGYSMIELEDDTSGGDDRTVWNAGLDLDLGPFGIGASYKSDDAGDFGVDDEETMVVGIDYTTGPFKIGVSYFDQENTFAATGADGVDGVDTKRYTGGVTYTYGPGMTFRGSISQVEHDNSTVDGNFEATSVMIGTQVNF